jgi:peptidoglycan/LPS O-acetylase OafA/YrhL
MGSLSYPIYLIHYQVGLVVVAFSSWIDLDYHRPSMVVLLLSLPLILLSSWIYTVIIERPIERVRRRVKTRGQEAPASGEVPSLESSSS